MISEILVSDLESVEIVFVRTSPFRENLQCEPFPKELAPDLNRGRLRGILKSPFIRLSENNNCHSVLDTESI
jgi:hypothetical protein